MDKQEAFRLSQENAIAKAAAEAEKRAQEEKLRKERIKKLRVVKPEHGAPATKVQRPDRAASSMAQHTASVRLSPPVIVQPTPGMDSGDRLKIEIRGHMEASKKYEIEIEGRQGDWKRLYHRSLGTDSGGVARFEVTLSQLASSQTGMEWRLRTRGESPQTPWSSWVSFRTAGPTRAKGRLKQPNAGATPAPRGRLKLPTRK